MTGRKQKSEVFIMNNTYRRRIGAKVTLVLLSVVLLLFLLSSAVSAQLPGDVNYDGIVDIRDVVLVQRHILGYQPPLTSAQLAIADVNGDGMVNIVDVNLMMQYIQGYINSFPTHHLHAPVLIAPAAGASVDGSMVSFQWGAVTGATRYQLEISKASDGTIFRTVDLGNVTSITEYAFANDGAQYRWRVRAGSSTQWGAWSLHRTFTNGAALPAPTLGSPANNAALDSTSVNFQWSAVTGATRYQLEVIRVSDGFLFKNVELGNTTSASQSGFPNDGTEYRWRVRAGNTHAWGAWTAYRYFSSGVVLPAPTLSSPANNSELSSSSVLFRWNAVSGATKYQLEVLRGTETAPFKDVTVGNITMSEQFGFLRDGTQYRWRVRAGNNTGWGAWSGYFTLTSGSIPVAPTLLSPANDAIVPGFQISFQWNAVTGANKYELEVVDKSNSAYVTKSILGDVTSSLERGFPNDASNYKWRVRAGSSEGWGPWSDYRNFTNGNPPTGPVLTYPRNNEVITGDRVTFEWDPAPGASRYELLIQYDTAGGTEYRRVMVGYVHATRQTDFPNDGSNFRWSVRSGNANGWGEFTTPFRKFTNGSPFTAPTLINPQAYASISSEPIQFSWNAVSNATDYEVEIVNVRFGTPVRFKAGNVTTTSQSGFGFADGTQYRWRVRAGDGTNWGAWSAARDFITQTTVAGAPAAPSLLSPATNATAATETIEFSWTTSAGALNYQLQVVRLSGGAIVVDGPLGNMTSSSESGFPVDGGEYLWRVRAGNATDWGPWSFYRGFTNGSWWVFPF
jgi:uncharacterized protein YegP (UPF0339 family)